MEARKVAIRCYRPGNDNPNGKVTKKANCERKIFAPVPDRHIQQKYNLRKQDSVLVVLVPKNVEVVRLPVRVILNNPPIIHKRQRQVASDNPPDGFIPVENQPRAQENEGEMYE